MTMNKVIEEFQEKYPTKEDKIKALESMTNEEIQELIDNSTNVQGKIFYSQYLKK